MSAPIQHGRRRGESREATPELRLDGNGMMRQRETQSGVTAPDLRQVTVLTKGDWDRIQFQLNKRNIEAEKQRQARAEKERLYEMSKENVKNWSNTIVGQRQKKLEARKLREEKEEEERKLIDIEEAKYQADIRKAAIEKAKTQQYYQTDRVKGFHGALLLSEVLKERDAQLELKRLKEKATEGFDDEWSKMSRKEYEEAITKDQNEALERFQKTRETAGFQKAQIMEHMKQLDKVKEEDQVEGDELKKLAARYEMERERLDDIRAKEAKHLMDDNLQQIQDVKKMRNIHKMQEEEEDDECRIFAAAKRKMIKLRAEKEKQLRNDKQMKLEAIREKLYAQNQQKIDDEDVRIQEAVQEGEAKREKEEADKEAKMMKTFQTIADHRHTQMKEREDQAAEKRRKELEMLLVRREADVIFAKNEDEKQKRKFEGAKDLSDFHLKQQEMKEKLASMQQEQELVLDGKNHDLLNLEEEQFHEYARRVIDHAEKGGRNTYPLRKAAREGAGGGLGPQFPGKGGVRPSYMTCDQTGVQLPNYQRRTTDETKQNIYAHGQSGKRLGFVW